jgi:hypothetical protein
MKPSELTQQAKKHAGQAIPNRAAKRAAQKAKLPFCSRCRRVFKYDVGQNGMLRKCLCGVTSLAASPAVIARVEKVEPPVKIAFWRRALGLFIVFCVGIVGLFVHRFRTGKWGRR